ncbi:hypothetical protein HPB50_020765 [Hyalomma asiaticum]|uniref:Uncharacterized protein n=1 Tax=Hyalomma asiaticum TaxID=266040 RepID=A0ACB7RK80_HYAAI|nr:hypothetical protein HPB50_020765 [Hyalomma asiaticum]
MEAELASNTSRRAAEACDSGPKACTTSLFTDIRTLLKILATLLSPQRQLRSFSELKHLKANLRNSSVEERLIGLALMSLYRESVDGRRKDRAEALQKSLEGRQDVIYTDAAEYKQGKVYAAVITRENGGPASCCSVRHLGATEAEEVAIALALTQKNDLRRSCTHISRRTAPGGAGFANLDTGSSGARAGPRSHFPGFQRCLDNIPKRGTPTDR